MHEAVRRVTDHHDIRLSQPLYSGGDIGGFTQGKLLLSPPTSHGPNHDEASMNPYADGELDTLLALQTSIQVSQDIKNP